MPSISQNFPGISLLSLYFCFGAASWLPLFILIKIISVDVKLYGHVALDEPYHLSHPNQLIPCRLIFTYRFNFYDNPSLMDGAEKLFFKSMYDNVARTVSVFNNSFNGRATINFLDNRKCRNVVAKVIPKLLTHFDLEVGRYQSDICKIAELYYNGGYYFDMDLIAMSSLDVEQNVSFVVLQPQDSGLFPLSFIASAPRNAVLLRTMENMVEYYRMSGFSSDDFPPIGSHTLTMAYRSLSFTKTTEYLILNRVSFPINDSKVHFHKVDCYFVASNASQSVIFQHGSETNNTNCNFN